MQLGGKLSKLDDAMLQVDDCNARSSSRERMGR